MKLKPILCLALVLSGGLSAFGQTNISPNLYVHFGAQWKRLVSARVHLHEAIYAGADDYLELTGQIDQRGTNLVADLLGSTGQQSQFYQGAVTLEKPFFAQGGAASGGAGGGFWFVVTTNKDSRPFVERVKVETGFTNAPVNFSGAVVGPQPVIPNISESVDPATGLPWSSTITNQIDPRTGLPLPPKPNKQP